MKRRLKRGRVLVRDGHVGIEMLARGMKAPARIKKGRKTPGRRGRVQEALIGAWSSPERPLDSLATRSRERSRLATTEEAWLARASV